MLLRYYYLLQLVTQLLRVSNSNRPELETGSKPDCVVISSSTLVVVLVLVLVLVY
jgi:hypothetical protein